MWNRSGKHSWSSNASAKQLLLGCIARGILFPSIISLKGRHIYAKNLLEIIGMAGVLLLTVLANGVEGGNGIGKQQHGETETRDYCLRETAVLNCEKTQIITITSAFYGRMRQESHCISSDYERFCSTDVTKLLDKWCSGKHNCTVVVKLLIDLYQPCGDLSSYLSVAYTCTSVVSPEHCRDSIQLPDDKGYFPFPSAALLPLGTRSCPWRFHAKPQQHIHIHLKSITKSDGIGGSLSGVGGRNGKCSQDVIFKEDNSDATSTTEGRLSSHGSQGRLYDSSSIASSSKLQHKLNVCELENKPNTVLYRSVTSEVEMYFPTVLTDIKSVLFYYQVVGCPALTPPTGGWVQHDDTMARIHCNNTRETWYLTCKGTKWNGITGNCSSGIIPGHTEDQTSGPFPFSIVMAVFLGVVIGIVLGVLMLFFVYACYKRGPKYNYEEPHNMNTSYYTGDIKDYSSNFSDGASTLYRDRGVGAPTDLNTTGTTAHTGIGSIQDYTTYQVHTNSCPSHSNASLYGKYMGILTHQQQPAMSVDGTSEAGTALLVSSHCPHSVGGGSGVGVGEISGMNKPSTKQDAQQTHICHTGVPTLGGKKMTPCYESSNRADRL